ncbi:MAG: hypothetical protein H0T51_12950 [Pirellulales bacterium]|nr:hypothetical protein [Pirellulales bacterium]
MRPRLFSIALLTAALAAAHGCMSLGAREKTDAIRQQADAAAYRAHPTTIGQLVLHADFDLPPEHRMLTELVAEREVICDQLKIPPSKEPIHVHLFADEASYRQHVSRKFPGFPERRAIFVETDVELSVYAHWGEAIAEDLRHEVAHGYLHASVPNIPLWLDEGLAEYFEVGRGRRGFNRMHVDYLNGQLAIGTWRPLLPRLEQLTTAADMKQLEYAESWLWVHFLLNSENGTADLLTEYLAALRSGEPVAPLSERMNGVVDQPATALLEHLKSITP